MSILNLTDNELICAMRTLTREEQKLVARHILGERTSESWELMRSLRRRLKRKIRSKLPRRLVWLE